MVASCREFISTEGFAPFIGIGYHRTSDHNPPQSAYISAGVHTLVYNLLSLSPSFLLSLLFLLLFLLFPFMLSEYYYLISVYPSYIFNSADDMTVIATFHPLFTMQQLYS
ncbi:uncharacterized protein EURHEDRAFT_239474 [Aspergillus ruber CBS 135680]|uniref:Uncharacterized protein n=1 Tax=Aspergillus ruber (strain CBS 135680) TaxID=1388766 RepID=A0A017S477_ASPRC|nr:uncharacterized protein EURHEDRAFT_239474 [Aspergillus ruber CBS 135680]EYE91621.1 hypothetical protein EURHEDRAFT_239474 [Aspergillus ruber CBS 135680]